MRKDVAERRGVDITRVVPMFITEWTAEEVIEKITQTEQGKADWEEDLEEYYGDVAIALKAAVLPRIMCNGRRGKELAWQLADGRCLTLETCDIGYYAVLLPADMWDSGRGDEDAWNDPNKIALALDKIDVAITYCAATSYKDCILLAHAAKRLDVSVTGAVPIRYRTPMTAIDITLIQMLKGDFV